MVRRDKPYRYTNGFGSYEEFVDKYEKHAAELGLKTWLEFARWVDEFCGGPKNADTDEWTRSYDKALLRYNNVTRVFGVLRPGGIIGTCFPPDDGRQYFEDQCR
jgi:pyocin large subunit-like protein